MIEITSCERAMELMRQDLMITGLVELIDPKLKVTQVAELFLKDNYNILEDLAGTGRINHYPVELAAKFCHTPPHNTVEYFRIEPYFIIKNLKTIYE